MDSMSFPKDRPAIGIIPLGTGNDLSRSLHWGGKYTNRALRKVCMDISKAEIVNMDRWTLTATIESNVSPEFNHAEDNLVSNYQMIYLNFNISLAFVL